MAKTSAVTGGSGENIHTRTTGDAVESQAVVIAIDGSDSVVPTDASLGLGVYAPGGMTVSDSNTGEFAVIDYGDSDSRTELEAGLLTDARLLMFDGTNYDRVRGDTTNGLYVDVTRLPALAAGSNNIGDVDVASVPRPSTTNLSNISDTASSVTLISANGSGTRHGLSIFNDSTEALFVKCGTTASATSFTVKILAGGYFEFPQPVYTGRVDGIWANDASGAARVTEFVT
jgi:hypothetical protein